MLGCTPQAYKACTCPASNQKKEPGVNNRDISGLMDGGSYTCEARSWSNNPPCASDGRKDMVAVFASAPAGKGRLPVKGKLMSGGLISYQGNQ